MKRALPLLSSSSPSSGVLSCCFALPVMMMVELMVELMLELMLELLELPGDDLSACKSSALASVPGPSVEADEALVL